MIVDTLKTWACAAVIGLVATGGAVADEAGKVDFMTYCANCHGTSGEGGGQLAKMLTVEVPNLTQIAKRNDGVFPFLEVAHIIDGRTGVRAHGSGMPVWGDYFKSDSAMKGDYGAVHMARGRVLSLVYYLEAFQQ